MWKRKQGQNHIQHKFAQKLGQCIPEGYCASHVTLMAMRTIIKDLWILVDGQWAEWDNWTECSVSCGNGTVQRRRACSDPLPDNGGLYCNGSDTEIEQCSLDPCRGKFTL